MSLLPSSKCLLPNEMVDLDNIEGGREGQLVVLKINFRAEALVDRSLQPVPKTLSNVLFFFFLAMHVVS